MMIIRSWETGSGVRSLSEVRGCLPEHSFLYRHRAAYLMGISEGWVTQDIHNPGFNLQMIDGGSIIEFGSLFAGIYLRIAVHMRNQK